MTQNNEKTYQLTLSDGELTIDIDDLIGIMHQLEAIILGFGMDFSVNILAEEVVKQWKAPFKG